MVSAYAQIRSVSMKRAWPKMTLQRSGLPCVGLDVKDRETGRTGLFKLPPSFPIDADRDIYSVFTELSLPFSEQPRDVSMRHEDQAAPLERARSQVSTAL